MRTTSQLILDGLEKEERERSRVKNASTGRLGMARRVSHLGLLVRPARLVRSFLTAMVLSVPIEDG